MNWKFWEGKDRRSQTAATVKAVSERELAARFALAPDNPLFEAVLTVLAERINALGQSAANEQLTDRQIIWRTAGVDALMEFNDFLRELEEQARSTQAETQNLTTDGHGG